MKVAILGCGRVTGTKEGWRIGHGHAKAYLEADPGVTLYGVDPDAENLRAFGERFKVPGERLFASSAALYGAGKVDLVSVCTWPGLHRPMVLEAVAAGVRGIICEKPMALDGSEVEEMLSACAAKGVRLAVAHQRCYEGPFVVAKQLIRQGVLGEGLTIEARVGDGWDVLSWTVHWFDMASWLLDSPAVSVLAGVDHSGQRRYRHAVEDSSVVQVEYAGGAQAVFVTGPPVVGGTMFCVRGSEGMLHIEGKVVRLWTKAGYQEPPVADAERSGFVGLAREMMAAVSSGRGEAKVECDAKRTAGATLLAYAAHESARTCRRMKLPSAVQYAPLEVMQHPPRSPAAAGRTVLLADAHHADPATGASGRDGLAQALRDVGVLDLRVIEAEKRELTAADLSEAELLVVYHTQRRSTAATREAVTRWVEGGRPLAVVHCGIGAWSDWEQYKKWLGVHWVWHGEGGTPSGHPHEPCVLRVHEGADLALSWVEAWLPRDEVYIQLGQSAEVRHLVSAELDGRPWPAAWQSVERPNVAVWGPGHRRDIWGLPVMHDGLRAIIELVRRASRGAGR